ncbi:hypothetical protein VNI00_008974 [Paramarasmius palmivorus]|uniref:Uncharacterized protein n=1 Tax=Paramarasmius palmivorus TaxID=297713 RepID=A0AAW0CSQ3_9AGAR
MAGDSSTKKARMCRKCLPEVHRMKDCPSYRRGGKKLVQDVQPSSPVTPSRLASDDALPVAPTQESPGPVDASPALQNSDPPTPPSLPSNNAESGVNDLANNDRDQIPIDPELLREDQNTAQNSPGTPLAAQSPDVNPCQTPRRTRSTSIGPMNLLGNGDTSMLLDTPSSSAASTPSSRQRASKRKPIFGHVMGVYRGTRHLTCHRTRKAVTPGKQVNIPKRFYDRTRSLMTKLEDLATETGCWIYFNAQLPTSQHPFIHYTSERLRSEGGELMDGVHQASRKMYSSLQAARRRDASQIAADLETVRDELTRAKDAEVAALKKAEEYRKALEEAGIDLA